MAALPIASPSPLLCESSLSSLDTTLTRVAKTMDRHDGYHRSSSAQAYLTPVESQRTNWTTLATHIVRMRLVLFNELVDSIVVGNENLVDQHQNSLGSLWCRVCTCLSKFSSLLCERKARGYRSRWSNTGEQRFPSFLYHKPLGV
jgi:hypothetical protein